MTKWRFCPADGGRPGGSRAHEQRDPGREAVIFKISKVKVNKAIILQRKLARRICMESSAASACQPSSPALVLPIEQCPPTKCDDYGWGIGWIDYTAAAVVGVLVVSGGAHFVRQQRAPAIIRDGLLADPSADDICCSLVEWQFTVVNPPNCTRTARL